MLSSANANAAPTNDPATLPTDVRDKVRALADEGMRLYEDKDYTSALSKFEQAEEFVLIPTITLQRGRCLERLGRWVEARDAYQLAAEMDLPASAKWQHQSAQREAASEQSALEPKIPRVSLVVKNGDGDLLVDGRPRGKVTTEPVLIDPGKHVVEVRAADLRVARSTVDLTSGQSITLELTLESQSGAGPGPFQLLGWIGVGLGGASLIVTIGTGVAAIQARDDLEGRCPGGRCPPDASADVDRYDGLRWSSGVFLFAGLAFAGGGVAALFLDPTHKPSGAARPILGPGFAGLEVTLP
ncbi:MAG: hypothetical protein U0271_22215 [Polyangiaceae bacterium]